MRGVGWFWKGVSLLLTAFAGLAGCTPYNHLRPPKPPEDFSLPPQNDARYSMPVEYPKDTLNQDTIGAKNGSPTGPGGPGGPGGGMGGGRGGGMGGGGMGGMGGGGMGGMGSGMGGMGR
jgi:hypothetical protein